MSRRRRILIFIGSFTLMSLFYFTLMGYRYFNLINKFPITAWAEDHTADCAVVLTGGPNRIEDAFEQLYLKRVKKVIISGVNPAAQLKDIFPQKVFYGDIDEDDIILEKRSLTTYGNAQQALPLVEALNCKDVVLITSKLHMVRAYSMFRKHFPIEIPIYKRSTIGKDFDSHWTRVASEAFKAVFYDFWLF
jgi:uncharacterized SAM-binding protein YcdF (DUF218 family)